VTAQATAKRAGWAALLFGIGFTNTGWAQAEAPPILMSTERVEGRPAWTTVAELAVAAEAGDPQAAYQYAQLLEFGDQVEADSLKARQFYRLAVAGGNANAAFRIGKAYADGSLGLGRDPSRALSYYRTAAAEVPEAIYNVGAMYVSGRGVRRDYVEGLAWLWVAGERGAGADAAEQVQKRLARYPDRIAAAERRAVAIRAELAQPAGERDSAPKAMNGEGVPRPAPVAAPKAPVARPSAPAVIKPDVAKPSFQIAPPTFSIPVPAPVVPVPVTEPPTGGEKE
jgi:hypothetical protein